MQSCADRVCSRARTTRIALPFAGLRLGENACSLQSDGASRLFFRSTRELLGLLQLVEDLLARRRSGQANAAHCEPFDVDLRSQSLHDIGH